VRVGQKEIDAIEARAVHLGGRGEIEHRLQVDRRLGIAPLADQPGPHRVVQLRTHVALGHVASSMRTTPRCAPARLRSVLSNEAIVT
jgi:hypothetical protein